MILVPWLVTSKHWDQKPDSLVSNSEYLSVTEGASNVLCIGVFGMEEKGLTNKSGMRAGVGQGRG